MNQYIGIIYCVKNKINGKMYIGQTISFKKRKTDHIYNALSGSNSLPALYPAIRKYGKDKFSWNIIDKFVTVKQANTKEVYWIKKLNSIKNGYNRTIGGDGLKGASKITRQKMSRARQGKTYMSKKQYREIANKRKGVPRTLRTKRKISKALMGRIIKPKSLFRMGRSLCKTKITIKIIKSIIKDVYSGMTVQCISTKYKINRDTLYKLFRKKGHFKYLKYLNNIDLNKVLNKIKENKDKAISVKYWERNNG